MTATMYRANVTRVDTDGVMVEIRDLGVGAEYGPCPLLNIQELNVGDEVLVANLLDVPEEMVVFGKLVDGATIPDVVPPGAGFLYAFEDATQRNAAGLTLVSGLVTWLDDEQRLEIYTDEAPSPGWGQLHVFRAGVQKLPAGSKVEVGTGAGTDGLRIDPALSVGTDPVSNARINVRNTDGGRRGITIQNSQAAQTAAHVYLISAAGSDTGPLLASMLTGEGVERFTIFNNGQLQWSNGTDAGDVYVVRNATGPGLQVMPRLSVGGTPASTASFTARQSTNRVGFFSNQTEAAVTHSLAHFYAIEAGNDDSRFIAAYKSGETTARFYQEAAGKMWWGPGGVTAPDTALSRGGIGWLQVGGGLSVSTFIDAASIDLDGDAYVGGELMVGPEYRDIGRGVVAQDGDSGNSAAIQGTETVVLTLPSKTYYAGRVYSVEVLGKVQYATATPVAQWRVRKTNAAGTELVDLGRTLSGGTGVAWPLNLKMYFKVGASDVTTVLVLTLTGAAANAATHVGPRTFTVYDEGIVANFDAPLTLS